MTNNPSHATSSDTPPAPTTSPKRRRLSARLLAIAIVASYLAVAFCQLFPQDFRNTARLYVLVATTAFMIRTFLFHFGLMLAAVAMLAAAMRHWRLALATVPLLAITLGPDLWSYAPHPAPPAARNTLTIVSANLLALNHDTAPITRRIAQIAPDVVVLQEYAPQWHAAFRKTLAAAYPHAQVVVRTDSFGLAVYARRPFVRPVQTDVPLGAAISPQFRTVLRFGRRDVALYNVHLMPPMGLTYTTEQRLQFADLLDRLRHERLPVILCGDFNFTNHSAYADALARLGLVDAHRISGHGRGTTWPAIGHLRFLPGIRLDHIFLSRELTSTSSRVIPIPGSDHRAIMAKITWKSEPH